MIDRSIKVSYFIWLDYNIGQKLSLNTEIKYYQTWQ